MGLSILGFTIGGLLALTLVLVGAIGIFGKKSLGQTVRGLFSWIPVGSPKLWAAVIMVIGLAAGGLSVGWGYVQGIGTTASIIGEEAPTIQDVALSCVMNAPTTATNVTGSAGNFSYRTDPADDTHYYIDVINGTGAGGGSVNGTLTCTSDRANIREGVAVVCHVEAESYKSLTSTTDSNTYYIVATSTSASKVEGYTWAQTAYLNSGAVATTSSDQEETSLVFAQDDVSQPLGFYMTLPGDTSFNYLTAQTSKNVKIICDGETVGKLTIMKVSI